MERQGLDARASSLRSPPLASFCWAASTCLFFALNSPTFFSRSAFNRMNAAEQRAYDEKLKTKMPFAVELPSGTFFEVTQTEADYFAEVAGQGARHGA